MSTETVYLDEGGVLVSSARVCIAGVTYPLRNITSVKTLREDPGNGAVILSITVMMAGLGVAVIGGLSEVGVVGLCVLAVGIGILVMWMKEKPKHWVVMGTAGTEQQALLSHDGAWIARVVAAINQAIIGQG